MKLAFKGPRSQGGGGGHAEQVPRTLAGICLGGLAGTWCTVHGTGLKGQTAIPAQWVPLPWCLSCAEDAMIPTWVGKVTCKQNALKCMQTASQKLCWTR